jgi:hypothetical protein
VGKLRSDWNKEQTDLVDKSRKDADAAVSKGRQDVQQKQTQAETQAADHIEKGNQDAEAERRKGEEKAEAARKIIVAAIKAIGEVLIAIADVVLAAFPKLRDRFRNAIKAVVKAAEAAVNALGETLKKGVQAALNLLGKALDAALKLLEKGYMLAVDLVSKAVQGAIAAAKAVVSALGVFAALIKDIAASPGQWLRNLAAGVMDGIKNHLWTAFQAAVKEWFNQKVDEVLGLGMVVWQMLKQGGIETAQVGQMAWEGIKAAIPPALIAILIEKLVSMIVPAAGTVMVIIEGLQAAWGTVSRILQAMERFMAFMKAVKTGNSGPQFGAMLAAAGVVLIDFVANWLLKRVRGAASKVGGKIKAIAKKIGDKLKKAAKKVGQKLKSAGKKVRDKFGTLKENFFGKKGGKGDKNKGYEHEVDHGNQNKKGKNNKPNENEETTADKQKRVNDAVATAVAAINSTFGGKEVNQAQLTPTLKPIKLRYNLQTLQANKQGNKWEIYGKVNPDNKGVTTALVGKKVEADEAQARAEAKDAIDKANASITRTSKLYRQRELIYSSDKSKERLLKSLKEQLEGTEGIQRRLRKLKTEFNTAAIKESEQAIQELKQVKKDAENLEKDAEGLEKWIEDSLRNKTLDDSRAEKENEEPDAQKPRKKGWVENETIEKQLASRGQLSALNRIPGGSLSPLSSQEVRGLTPQGLEARLQ